MGEASLRKTFRAFLRSCDIYRFRSIIASVPRGTVAAVVENGLDAINAAIHREEAIERRKKNNIKNNNKFYPIVLLAIRISHVRFNPSLS